MPKKRSNYVNSRHFKVSKQATVLLLDFNRREKHQALCSSGLFADLTA